MMILKGEANKPPWSDFHPLWRGWSRYVSCSWKI